MNETINKSIMLIAMFVLVVILAGCGGLATYSKQSTCEPQKNSCIDQCNQQGYWLPSDKEHCIDRCSSEYQSCMGS